MKKSFQKIVGDRNKTKLFEYSFSKREIVVFIVLLLIRIIYFFSYDEIKITPDFITYFEYNFSALLHLDFSNAGRTPVYPLVLRILTGGREEHLFVIVIFQSIVSYLSLFYFYGLAKLLVKKDSIALIGTFFYGASSMVFLYDNAVLTESLALSGTVVFFYHVVKYIKYNRTKDFVKCNSLLLIMIFLRPSFLLFNVILTAMLLVRLIMKNKLWNPLVVNSLSWVIILIYSLGFYSSFGYFSISDPMPRQLMLVCIDRGYFENHPDEDFADLIDDSFSKYESGDRKRAVWNAYYAVSEKYDQKDTLDFAKECIKNNIEAYIFDEAKVASSVLRHGYLDNSYTTYKEKPMTIVDIINNIFNNIYPVHTLLIGAWALVAVFVELIRNKKLDWLMIGFAVFIFGIFFSTIVATNGEFVRTMIHIVPISYLGVLYYIGKYVYNNEDYSEELKIHRNAKK